MSETEDAEEQKEVKRRRKHEGFNKAGQLEDPSYPVWCCHQNVCLCPDSGEAGADHRARGGGQFKQDRQEDDGRRGVSDS